MPHTNLPFQSDAEYLSLEYDWLRARAKRIAAAEEHQELQDSAELPDFRTRHTADDRRSARLVLSERTAEEEELRQKLDQRLATHRKAGPFKLGLDELCERFEFDAIGRMALLIIALPGLGEQFSTSVLKDLLSFYPPITPETLARLLDTNQVSDLLRLRAMFDPGGLFYQSKIFEVDHSDRIDHPTDIFSWELHVKLEHWRSMFGMAATAS